MSSSDALVEVWAGLRAAAISAAEQAYAPYSGYSVGAAALADDGRIVRGCNVENAAYGVTLCAECGLVSQLHLTGGGRLTHFVCVGHKDGAEAAVIMPCGRCRQLLWENGGAELVVLTPNGERTMAEVLPDAFGTKDLA
jgi:cytidine deaminase